MSNPCRRPRASLCPPSDFSATRPVQTECNGACSNCRGAAESRTLLRAKFPIIFHIPAIHTATKMSQRIAIRKIPRLKGYVSCSFYYFCGMKTAKEYGKTDCDYTYGKDKEKN